MQIHPQPLIICVFELTLWAFALAEVSILLYDVTVLKKGVKVC